MGKSSVSILTGPSSKCIMGLDPANQSLVKTRHQGDPKWLVVINQHDVVMIFKQYILNLWNNRKLWLNKANLQIMKSQGKVNVPRKQTNNQPISQLHTLLKIWQQWLLLYSVVTGAGLEKVLHEVKHKHYYLI